MVDLFFVLLYILGFLIMSAVVYIITNWEILDTPFDLERFLTDDASLIGLVAGVFWPLVAIICIIGGSFIAFLYWTGRAISFFRTRSTKKYASTKDV